MGKRAKVILLFVEPPRPIVVECGEVGVVVHVDGGVDGLVLSPGSLFLCDGALAVAEVAFELEALEARFRLDLPPFVCVAVLCFRLGVFVHPTVRVPQRILFRPEARLSFAPPEQLFLQSGQSHSQVAYHVVVIDHHPAQE